MRLSKSIPAVVIGLSCGYASQASAKVMCTSRNWNHGTQQSISVQLPEGSTTKKIVISVKNLTDNSFEGTCPSHVKSSSEEYETRQCEPEKFHDMTVEFVRDRDEGDKHSVTVEIKNGDQAPPREVKLCVKYDE